MDINNNNIKASYQAYQDYIALKNHFTRAQYDYFKYNGKVAVSKENFLGRRDRSFFDWIGRHNDSFGFLLSNIIINPNIWIGELRDNPKCKENYIRWKKTLERLQYEFDQQITLLNDTTLDQWIMVPEHKHPLLLRLYFQQKLSPEILIIIIDSLRCFSYWDKQMKDDIVWGQVATLYKKYKPFLSDKYDRTKMRKKLLNLQKKQLTNT